MNDIGKEYADYLRRMADDIESDDPKIIDFMAFFHIHKDDEGSCIVLPIGVLAADGHLLESIPELMISFLPTAQDWMEREVVGALYPVVNGDNMELRFSELVPPDDEVEEEKR